MPYVFAVLLLNFSNVYVTVQDIAIAGLMCDVDACDVLAEIVACTSHPVAVRIIVGFDDVPCPVCHLLT